MSRSRWPSATAQKFCGNFAVTCDSTWRLSIGQLHSLQNALHHQHVHAAHAAATARCRYLAVSKNLAFVSQFVEIPEDVVFTVEYSVRAAQMAVYQLMHIDRVIPPVTRHDQSLAVEFGAVMKAFQ